MPYVRDVMKKEIIIGKLNDDIQHISRILMEKKISNIPIVDAKGKLAGIVSEKDIIKAMESENFMKIKAKDIMTTNVFSVKENDCLEYVSKIFIEHPYRRLPVTRDKKIVGTIAREDIISHFMGDYY